jgi:hypothetical protein
MLCFLHAAVYSVDDWALQSAYVSIRQHTAAYVRKCSASCMRPYIASMTGLSVETDLKSVYSQHTAAYVSIRHVPA